MGGERSGAARKPSLVPGHERETVCVRPLSIVIQPAKQTLDWLQISSDGSPDLQIVPFDLG